MRRTFLHSTGIHAAGQMRLKDEANIWQVVEGKKNPKSLETLYSTKVKLMEKSSKIRIF